MKTDTSDMLEQMFNFNLNEPPDNGDDFSLEVDQYGLRSYANTFKWLFARLTYAPELDEEFYKFRGNSDHNYWRDVEDWITSRPDFEELDVLNTANFENTLDTILQWHRFIYDNRDFLILSVHRGGDYRGNYSSPHVFEVIDPDYLYDMYTLNIFGGDNTMMYSDDCGYHWYNDNCDTYSPDFQPLDNLYEFDPDVARIQIEIYNERMTSAGLDPSRQLELARARLNKMIPDAIERTKEFPDTIFYTDDESVAYWRGERVTTGSVDF